MTGTGDALSGVGTNGGGSLMGESPQAGWEGESELGFPLDDVPKDVAEPSGSGESFLQAQYLMTGVQVFLHSWSVCVFSLHIRTGS